MGRLLGFVMLAAPAAAVLAGIVLVPQYAQLERLKHQRDCLAARTSEAQSVVIGYDRLIAAAREDETQVKRLAMSQLGMQPRNEIVVLDRDLPSATPPTLIVPAVQPLPPAPDDWIIRLEPKMTNPRIRLGLALLAIGCLTGAVFIFALPNTRPRKADTPQPLAPDGMKSEE